MEIKKKIYESWFTKNVVFVNDVLKENNSIMTLNEFNTKYDFEVPSPIYNKLRAAIKKWVKKENAKKVKMSTMMVASNTDKLYYPY